MTPDPGNPQEPSQSATPGDCVISTQAVAAERPTDENHSQLPPGALVRQRQGGAIKRGNPKGTPPGAGQPAAFFRRMCQDGLYKARTVDVLVAIISGDILEKIEKADGTVIIGETKNSDRIKAAAFLAGYAYGQPVAQVKIEDTTPREELTPEMVLARLAGMARNLHALGSPATQAALAGIVLDQEPRRDGPG